MCHSIIRLYIFCSKTICLETFWQWLTDVRLAWQVAFIWSNKMFGRHSINLVDSWSTTLWVDQMSFVHMILDQKTRHQTLYFPKRCSFKRRASVLQALPSSFIIWGKMGLSHFVNLLFGQFVILSTCCFVNLPFCQLAALSICHFVNLLFCQISF